MFTSLPRPASAVDACAATLRAAILDGRLAAGSRLPPERDLAERFGVNRVTVRSALGRLATAGLLSVRQGSGYVVRDYRKVGGPDLVAALVELAQRGEDRAAIAADLLLVRRALAEAVLHRLIEAPPAKERVDRVRAAVDAFADVARGGASPVALAEADTAALGEVLDATGSPVLRLFVNPVTALLGDLPDLCAALYASPDENVAAYRLLLAWMERPRAEHVEPIVAAIRARDADTLARLDRALAARAPRDAASSPRAPARRRTTTRKERRTPRKPR